MWLTEVLKSFLTVYQTPKVVQVKSKKIALCYRLIQVIIILYIAGYNLYYKGGYQETSSIESALITKIKGTAFANLKDNPNLNPKFNKEHINYYERTWDAQDIIYPAMESNAFFLTTNMVLTPSQKPGTCPDENDPNSGCDVKNPKECLSKSSIYSDAGKFTGKCVESQRQNKTICEIQGWCPVEDDELPLTKGYPLFEEIQNFTVLIKNTVRFTSFNILKRNMDETEKTISDLKTCRFHPETNPRCPIFKIGDIINFASLDYNEIAYLGGVVGIEINWKCNLDRSLNLCFPSYTFRQLDLKNALVSPGFNFRYIDKFSETERALYKVYGIRFLILTTGEGRKFSFLPLLLNIGSGVGLLAIATLVCDTLMLYFTPEKDIYKDKKYLFVDVTKSSNYESINSSTNNSGFNNHSSPNGSPI